MAPQTAERMRGDQLRHHVKCEAEQRWEPSHLVPTTRGCPWVRGKMASLVQAGETHGYATG